MQRHRGEVLVGVIEDTLSENYFEEECNGQQFRVLKMIKSRTLTKERGEKLRPGEHPPQTPRQTGEANVMHAAVRAFDRGGRQITDVKTIRDERKTQAMKSSALKFRVREGEVTENGMNGFGARHREGDNRGQRPRRTDTDGR